MTCIVGIVQKGIVYMGGDSLASEPESMDKLPMKNRKVFHNGPFLIGACGSLRMAQILQHGLKPPPKPKLMEDMKFMATRFIDEVRAAFLNNGYGKIREGGDNEGGNFLVGFGGKLYEVHNDFQVGEWSWGYASIGSGRSYAYGSLFMSENEAPELRITSALEAAAHFNAGVAPPFYVLKQPASTAKKVGR